MANVATTKYQSYNGGDWVEIKLEWSYTNTATTATISAALYVRRDSYGPTEGNDQYWISLDGTKFVDSSGYHTIGTSFVQVCSGSKTINLKDSGASATAFTLDGYYNNNLSSTKLHALRVNKANYSGGHWTTSYGTQGSPLGTTIPAQTSACGAPTSVSASGIIKPNGGKFTVSWSGAKSGTNNTIATYQVYYKIGSAPTTSSYYASKNVDVTNGTTSGSTEFEVALSDSDRGKIIYVGVVTRGTAGASYYSGIKTGGSVTINSLPTKPTLNKSNQTIASTSTGVSVTATAGSDADTSQTKSIYYSTSTTGTKTKGATVTINPNAGSSSTYYFWTYDGLEYSSQATSITITKNSKPVINNSTLTNKGITLSTYAARWDTNWVYAVALKAKSTNKSSGTYQVNYTYAYDDATFPSYSLLTSGSFSSAEFSIGTIDMEQQFAKLGLNFGGYHQIQFKLAVRIHDGIEYSDWWFYNTTGGGTSSSSAGIYVYAGALLYNGTVPTDKIATTFSAQLRNDARLDNWSIVVKKGNTTITSSITSNTVSNNVRIFNIVIGDIPAGGTIDCTITGSRASPAISKSYTFTRTVRVKTTITTLSFGAILDAFNSSSSGYITLAGKWGDDFTSGNKTFNIIAYKGNYSKTVKTISLSYSADTAYSNSNNSYTIANLFSDYSNTASDDNLGITHANYIGNQSYQLRCSVTNTYGETIIFSPSTTYYINFNKTAEVGNLHKTTGNKVQYKKGNSWYNFGNSSDGYSDRYIQQGIGLVFAYRIYNYSYKNITLELRVATNSNFTGEKTVGSKTISIGTGDTASGVATPKIIDGWIYYGNTQNDNTTVAIGEIADDAIRYWRIVAIQNDTRICPTPNTSGLGVIKSTTPTNFSLLSILSITSNNRKGYEVKYKLENTGISVISGLTSATIALQYNDGSNWISIDEPVNAQTGVSITTSFYLPQGQDIQSSFPFRIVLTTKVLANNTNNYLENAKTTISSSIVVYVEEPVVAYRKDQLGIHTKSPASDAFLDIRTTKDKEILYIKKGTDTMLKISFEGTNVTVFDIP